MLCAPHGCGAAKPIFALTWAALSQQIRHVDELLRDLAQALAAVHGHASQRLKRFVLVHAASLHQDPLGALDLLPFRKLEIGLGQLRAQPLILVESRHCDFDDGLDARCIQPVDNIGGNARAHRVSNGIGRVVAREHHDWARLVAADHHYVLQYVAAGRIGIDDDDVGTDLLHRAQQLDRAGERRGNLVAGAFQPIAQHHGALGRFVHYQHAHPGPFDEALLPTSQGPCQRAGRGATIDGTLVRRCPDKGARTCREGNKINLLPLRRRLRRGDPERRRAHHWGARRFQSPRQFRAPAHQRAALPPACRCSAPCRHVFSYTAGFRHVAGAGREMKFPIAKNSLFAILLRSPWWISILIAAGIVAAARLALPELYAFAFFAALPFIVIGCVAGWRQLRAPSAARVAGTLEAVRAMSWGDFSSALTDALRDDGYAVTRLTGAAADFELAKG